MLIDSHCHLDDEQFDADRGAVIERALAAGVERMVAIGTGDGPPDLEAGLRLADSHPAFYATVGVHPHDASKASVETYRRLEGLKIHDRSLWSRDASPGPDLRPKGLRRQARRS